MNTASPLASESLDRVARRLRGELVAMAHRTGAPHLGSALSCLDILIALYWRVLRLNPQQPADPLRDRFILSKGHAAAALYVVLAGRGLITADQLQTYTRPGSRLPEHPILGCVPGVEVTSGSLGHGLPLGIGLALAARIRQLTYRVFVLLSDGECNEGSVWEAALFAPAQQLDNVIAIVDYNKWQATGRSQEVMSLHPLVDKWRAFGWEAVEADGHDVEQLSRLCAGVPGGSGRPLAIIAHTIKGKGVTFMEDDNNWHYRIPNADEVRRARQELGLL